mgnify:CR=1 FL=1
MIVVVELLLLRDERERRENHKTPAAPVVPQRRPSRAPEEPHLTELVFALR